MKKLLLFGAFALIIFGCANNTSPEEQSNDENDEKARQEQLEKERALAEKERRDSINVLLDGISVELFEHSGGTYDMEGWFMDGGRVYQLKKFDNSKTHTCSQGAYIQKVVVLGNCDNINLQFFNSKDEIIEDLKDYTLEEKVAFETEIVYNPESGSHAEKKGPNHKDWFRNATKMTISYKDRIFYSASWKSSSQRWRQ